MDKPLIVCTFWGLHPLPSVKIRCSLCPNEIAVDNTNFDEKIAERFSPICPECFLKLADPKFGGFALGGRVIDVIEKASFPMEIIETSRALVKRWKSSRN